MLSVYHTYEIHDMFPLMFLLKDSSKVFLCCSGYLRVFQDFLGLLGLFKVIQNPLLPNSDISQ